jgi:hypothetical protein
MKEWLISLGRRFLSVSARRKIVRYTRWPPVGWVRFGNLRRLQPISADWGTDRGRPIDRYYIEAFLARHADDIHGRVLEIGSNTYTRAFGGDQVAESIVLHVAEQKEQVTLIGSLTDESTIPSDHFDCLIITQTLQAIYDVPAAVRTMYHGLKPGGVALITLPGISKISRYDMDRWGYYWSFTTRSAQRLFGEIFPEANLQIKAHGSVVTAIAFLHGLALEELKQAELDYFDPDYELLITVRAVKPALV